MSFRIRPTLEFGRSVKRLSKKYRSLPHDVNKLVQSLQDFSQAGTALGHNYYKIRLGIANKGSGKSGGARVIT